MTKDLSSEGSKRYVRDRLVIQARRLWTCGGAFVNSGSRWPRSRNTFAPSVLLVNLVCLGSGQICRYQDASHSAPLGAHTSPLSDNIHLVRTIAKCSLYKVPPSEFCFLIMQDADLRVGGAWGSQVSRK